MKPSEYIKEGIKSVKLLKVLYTLIFASTLTYTGVGVYQEYAPQAKPIETVEPAPSVESKPAETVYKHVYEKETNWKPYIRAEVKRAVEDAIRRHNYEFHGGS